MLRLQARIFHGIGLLLADSLHRLDDGIVYIQRATGLWAFDYLMHTDLARLLLRKASNTTSSTSSSTSKQEMMQARSSIDVAIDLMSTKHPNAVCIKSGATSKLIQDMRRIVAEIVVGSGDTPLTTTTATQTQAQLHWKTSSIKKLSCAVSGKDEL